MKQQLLLRAEIVSNRKCTFDETFFALKKLENKYNSKKYNYVPNTSFSDLYEFTGSRSSSHFVICNLYIAIWVIQIKCRSCKRIKTLTSMHVPGTKLEESLVQLVQILRFEG